jgi:hypothetical protein
MQVETKVWVVKDIAFRTSLRITKVRKQITLNEKYVKRPIIQHKIAPNDTDEESEWMIFSPLAYLIFPSMNMIIDTNRCVCVFLWLVI